MSILLGKASRRGMGLSKCSPAMYHGALAAASGRRNSAVTCLSSAGGLTSRLAAMRSVASAAVFAHLDTSQSPYSLPGM